MKKTIKIDEETWRSLMELKIQHSKRSIDEVVQMLLKIGKEEAI